MFKNQLLHIELLKHILKKNKYFGYVEVKTFLLSNFPEEPHLRERKKMKDFLKFLSSEEYIEVRDKRGICIIQEAGVEVARKDISAIIKIKQKGVNLVEQNQLNNYNKGGIMLSAIFGLTTLVLGIYSIYITQNLSDLETQIEQLNREKTVLQTTNKFIELQIDEFKKELSTEIPNTENEKK